MLIELVKTEPDDWHTPLDAKELMEEIKKEIDESKMIIEFWKEKIIRIHSVNEKDGCMIMEIATYHDWYVYRVVR